MRKVTILAILAILSLPALVSRTGITVFYAAFTRGKSRTPRKTPSKSAKVSKSDKSVIFCTFDVFLRKVDKSDKSVRRPDKTPRKRAGITQESGFPRGIPVLDHFLTRFCLESRGNLIILDPLLDPFYRHFYAILSLLLLLPSRARSG